MITDEFKNNFNKLVENKVISKNYSYIDAVVQVCEDNGVDIVLAAKWLSNPIKEKIMIEGQSINLLPKTKNALPI